MTPSSRRLRSCASSCVGVGDGVGVGVPGAVDPSSWRFTPATRGRGDAVAEKCLNLMLTFAKNLCAVILTAERKKREDDMFNSAMIIMS